MHKSNTYLALGDSYTIGESVAIFQSFPYQLIATLRKEGMRFSAPEIIARTGWTTGELATAMESYPFLEEYDLITLLIGVNNQYRGRTVEEYNLELESLLKKAISLAKEKSDGVIMLSIPDYSVTPFSQDTDREKTAREIELFNSVNRALSVQYKIQYVDITESTREAKTEASLLAADGLHPSEKEYKKWAEKLAAAILSASKK